MDPDLIGWLLVLAVIAVPAAIEYWLPDDGSDSGR